MVTRSLALVALIGACSPVELAQPRVTTHRGPAAARELRRVVALPATCGSLATTVDLSAKQYRPTECSQQAVAAVDVLLRGELEFRGYHVIDSERVNALTGARRETIVETRHDTSTSVEASYSRFHDATPAQQAELLRELGADGVLSTRMWIGAGDFDRKKVLVQVRLIAASDSALAWSRRCELEANYWTAHDTAAIERGVRCAFEQESTR